MGYRVGVDTGGTFTDLVGFNEETGEWSIAKVPSTPHDPSRAVFDAFARGGVPKEEIAHFVHGTTVATNTLLERKGVGVALLTTEGFRDVLRIQRTTRPDHFDLHWVKPRHLVHRSLCFGIPERVLYDGTEYVSLDENAVREAIRSIRARGGVEAVAVSYLFSFMNPAHELRTREIITEEWPEAEVSLSCEVYPRWREYERTSTTVIDAYLKPKLRAYLSSLEAECKSSGPVSTKQVLVMRSNGGVITARKACNKPSALVQSGPAGGVIAASHLSHSLGLKDVLACDMGGTSFEACLLLNGEPGMTNHMELEWGVPVALPMVDVRSIGAGGGSIARVDVAGILKVGPQSAGADPGPCCYGLGGVEPTITDANAALGRLAPEFLLGGDLKLDLDAADEALQRLGDRLGMDGLRAAKGVLDVAMNNMAQAFRVVSTDRGYDPRDASALLAYGGGGPLHACELARDLHIQRVVVPRYAGAFCAYGALLADTRFDYEQTYGMRLKGVDISKVNELFNGLEERALQDFRDEGFKKPPVLQRYLDMRYIGQNWELSVTVPGAVLTHGDMQQAEARFGEEHERFYHYSIPGEPLEILTFKVVAVGSRKPFDLPRLAVESEPERLGTRSVLFDTEQGHVSCDLWWHESLPAGFEFDGPALVGQIDATTLVPPGAHAKVDSHGNILIALA